MNILQGDDDAAASSLESNTCEASARYAELPNMEPSLVVDTDTTVGSLSSANLVGETGENE